MDDLERQRRKRAEREQYNRAAERSPATIQLLTSGWETGAQAATLTVIGQRGGTGWAELAVNVAQHTWTPGCDGFHPSGACP
jgi:hypothetical protein